MHETKALLIVRNGLRCMGCGRTVEYKNIQSFEVVFGERATEIGLETDENSRDEFNEYLVITLEDGETSTFCNSHVDLFRI